MDECSQAVEPSSLIPLICKHKGLILVGDEQQLPPTIFSQECKDFNYNQSLFERLIKNVDEKNILLLNVQYRMHKELAHYMKKTFYPHYHTSSLLGSCTSKYHKFLKMLLFCDIDGVYIILLIYFIIKIERISR